MDYALPSIPEQKLYTTIFTIISKRNFLKFQTVLIYCLGKIYYKQKKSLLDKIRTMFSSWVWWNYFNFTRFRARILLKIRNTRGFRLLISLLFFVVILRNEKLVPWLRRHGITFHFISMWILNVRFSDPSISPASSIRVRFSNRYNKWSLMYCIACDPSSNFTYTLTRWSKCEGEPPCHPLALSSPIFVKCRGIVLSRGGGTGMATVRITESSKT